VAQGLIVAERQSGVGFDCRADGRPDGGGGDGGDRADRLDRRAWAACATRPRLHLPRLGAGAIRPGGGRYRADRGNRPASDPDGGLSHWTFAQGLRAEALLSAGRHAEALGHAERALATAVETGERAYLSRLHRIRGVLLRHLRGAADPEVEASLQQALAVAREQDAKGWEIAAATALARL
jgi:hypothetical protein